MNCRVATQAGEQAHSSGFTILEVLVAISILGIVVAYSSSAIISSQKHNRTAKVRTEAIHAAQTVLDEIRHLSFSEIPTSGTDAPRSISFNDQRTYEVTVSYCTTASFCPSASIRQLEIEVRFRGKPVYLTETAFADFGAKGTVASAGSSTSSSAGSSSTTSSSAGASSTSSSSSSSSSSSTSSSATSSSSSTSSSCHGSSCRPKWCKWWRC